MLERDYLLRLLIELADAIRRSFERADNDNDPVGAAESLEAAIGSATELEGAILLSLAPESLASVLQVSGTDPRVVGYVARSLILDGNYWKAGGSPERAKLREAQGLALASAYGIDVSNEPMTMENFEHLFDSTKTNL